MTWMPNDPVMFVAWVFLALLGFLLAGLIALCVAEYREVTAFQKHHDDNNWD